MRDAVAVLVAMVLVSFAGACAHGPERQAAGERIVFERQQLRFEPTRADFSIARVLLTVYCSRLDEVRLDGAEPASTWNYLDLKPIATNTFELTPLTITVAPEARGVLCLSVKVFFDQVDNMYDSLFYLHPDDRYALVAYCSDVRSPDWPQAQPRFAQNRVASLAQFRQALATPFVIGLNQRPLSDLACSRSGR